MQEIFGKFQNYVLNTYKSGRYINFLLPSLMLFVFSVIFIPLPSYVLDILLALNISIGVIILLTTLFVKKPLEFSIFPTVLLATTMFRLVLNISTTRLILSRAHLDGELAAGHVVKNFADFVAAGNVVVGIVIFVIIFIIQYMVITKGATRVAEVAARFTLDAMPGKQMAIDADLNAGMIDEKTARKRRDEIRQQADFFGAMDGASKFVSGDAIAGIIITFVNILGGLAIGMFMFSMPLDEALHVFTKLTIGDGLVSQVPALLISLGTGFLVTSNSDEKEVPKEFFGQMFGKPVVLCLTAFFLMILMLTELPKIPLGMIAISAIGLAFVVQKKIKNPDKEASETDAAPAAPAEEDKPERYLKVDPMELEIGLNLIPLADPAKGGDLLDRIHRLRKEVASDIGIILPRVRIRDSFQIDQIAYRIKIAGQPVAMGIAYPDLYMAIDGGMQTTGEVQGIETVDPAFGTPALWIEEASKDQAEIYGYTVVEPNAVIATHLLETIRKHADEILTRDGTQELLNALKEDSPTVVDDLIGKVITVGQVQQVLGLLLREQVPIKQLGLILETIGDYAAQIKDPTMLLHFVRQKLARTICTKYRDDNGALNVVMLDPTLEDQIRAGFEHNQNGLFIRMSAPALENLCKKILKELDKLTSQNYMPVVLVNQQIRFALKQMTSATIPNLAVLGLNEITHDTQVNSMGYVTL